MKLALDVSKWQGAQPIVNRKDEIAGVVIRTSDGVYVDPLFEENLVTYKEYPISLYHYTRANYNVDAQISLVMDAVEKATKTLGYQPTVCLDVEDNKGVAIVGRGTAIKRLYEMATKLDDELKQPTYIYTSKTKWEAYFGSYEILRYRKEYNYLTDKYLWVAVYFTNEILDKAKFEYYLELIEGGTNYWSVPEGNWKEVIMWQFGHTNAILANYRDVDVNIVYNNWAFEHGTQGEEPPQEPSLTIEERLRRLEEIVAKCCPNA